MNDIDITNFSMFKWLQKLTAEMLEKELEEVLREKTQRIRPSGL